MAQLKSVTSLTQVYMLRSQFSMFVLLAILQAQTLTMNRDKHIFINASHLSIPSEIFPFIKDQSSDKNSGVKLKMIGN